MTNIYVGNLSLGTTEDSLRTAFARFGRISIVKIITGRRTGCPWKFAIVEMDDEIGARAAIDALNGTDLDGRPMYVPARRQLQMRHTLPQGEASPDGTDTTHVGTQPSKSIT